MGKKIREILKTALFPIVVTGVLIIFLSALSNLNAGSGDEGKKQLEQAIKRGVISCYATEGFYPPNLEYLEEHYGIRVDEEQYVVIYDVFAENLMPDITVLEKKHEK